jgi:hypothetical protein
MGKGRRRQVDNRRTLHIEANMMAVVAFDSTEWPDDMALGAYEPFPELKPIAEARPISSGFCSGFKRICNPRKVISDVEPDDRPTVLASGPYRMLKQPFAFDELDAERAAYRFETHEANRIRGLQVVAVENSARLESPPLVDFKNPERQAMLDRLAIENKYHAVERWKLAARRAWSAGFASLRLGVRARENMAQKKAVVDCRKDRLIRRS